MSYYALWRPECRSSRDANYHVNADYDVRQRTQIMCAAKPKIFSKGTFENTWGNLGDRCLEHFLDTSLGLYVLLAVSKTG